MLCYVSGCLSRPRPCSVRGLCWLLCCLLLRHLWGSIVGRERSPPFVPRLVGASLPTALSLLMAPLPRVLFFDVVVMPPRFGACGGPLSLSPMPKPLGAPSPCARRLVGASPPIALPLLIATLLRALSPLVDVLPPALLLHRRVRLGSWPPLRRLCARWWALGCLSLCRSRCLPCPVHCLSMLLCCLLLCCSWGSAVACALTQGRSYAPFAWHGGRFVALCSALLIAPPLCAVSSEVVVLPPAPLPAGFQRRIRLGSWAPLRPLCYCPWALRYLSLFRSRSHPCSARCLSWLLCCLLLCCLWGSAVAYAWARGRSFAPSGECSWALRCLLPRCSHSLQCSVRFPPRWLCCLLPCRSWAPLWLRLGSWVPPPPPLCDYSWALGCLVLCRSRSLPWSVRCLSRWLCCLLLCRSWGSAFGCAWARGRSSALSVTARGCFDASVALDCSCGPCSILRGWYVASCSTALGL